MNQGDLFGEGNTEAGSSSPLDINWLYELSCDAYYSILYARLSELPLEIEIEQYIEKIRITAEKFSDKRSSAAREACNTAAKDRGDPYALAILVTAAKVQSEVHLLTGLLRFNPDENGVYIARCAPDYFILPALADHFTLRFGETPWSIIDENRNLCLFKENGREAVISYVKNAAQAVSGDNDDPWEGLWQLYHRSINNKARSNPRLQQQFMPKRYQKYLPEFKG